MTFRGVKYNDRKNAKMLPPNLNCEVAAIVLTPELKYSRTLSIHVFLSLWNTQARCYRILITQNRSNVLTSWHYLLFCNTASKNMNWMSQLYNSWRISAVQESQNTVHNPVGIKTLTHQDPSMTVAPWQKGPDSPSLTSNCKWVVLLVLHLSRHFHRGS